MTAYCDLENLPLPKYVGHPHSHGDRYEVKVCGTSFHGLRKFYPSVTEAIHGCAHNALYCILVSKAPLEAQEELAPKPPQNKLTKGAVSLTDTSPGGTKKRKAKNSAAKVPASSGLLRWDNMILLT